MTPTSIKPLRNTWMAIAVAALVSTPGPTAHAAVLYDASPNTLPATQGWTYFDSSFGSATQSVTGGVYTLDSTNGADNNIQVGISRTDQTLDATAGYTLRFDLRIDSEAHATDHRAGTSVLVVSQDTTQALELAFWEDEIWGHDDTAPIFVASHAEGVSTDPTAAIVRYDLAIQGTDYELFADGASILTGPLRDYTAWVGFPDVYETPNFIFFGDDTTSARGITEITRIELNPIPEPTSAMAWLIGMVTVAGIRRRRRIILN